MRSIVPLVFFRR